MFSKNKEKQSFLEHWNQPKVMGSRPSFSMSYTFPMFSNFKCKYGFYFP